MERKGESQKDCKARKQPGIRRCARAASGFSGSPGIHMKKGDKKFFIYLMLAVFGAISMSILFFFLLYKAREVHGAYERVLGILMPFLYGGAIAYLLKPVCNFWERMLEKLIGKRGRGKRLIPPLSILISLLLGLGSVCALLVLVLPQLLSSISAVARTIPQSIDELTVWIMKYAGENEVIGNYITEFLDSVSVRLPDWLSSTLLPWMQTLLNGFSNSIFNIVTVFSNLFLGVIVAVYLLGSRRTLARQGTLVLRSLMRRRWADAVLSELHYMDRMFGGFINGKLVDSLIIGILCFAGMTLLGLPYAVLVSVIVGVTNIIPFFGPYIGAVPSALLILMVNPLQCVIFLVFIILLQQFDGNILGPKILGNVTGLSSLWVLFAILFFGGLFGFIGMIVGVPVFAVLYDLIRKGVRRGLAYRQRQEDREAQASSGGGEES